MSQHLRATRQILDDVTSDAKYVQIGGMWSRRITQLCLSVS